MTITEVYLHGGDVGEQPVTVEGEIVPAEKQSFGYPGSPAYAVVNAVLADGHDIGPSLFDQQMADLEAMLMEKAREEEDE